MSNSPGFGPRHADRADLRQRRAIEDRDLHRA
jgi:hypothetical protein